ncbi:MAG: gfo/Idh/MocA family oxidoreductase [Betaproteobacteria bacterium]|nr:MAG: gfo/Idh/MocA family oxidoreductase [Betaproteobacteria bacterium]
MSSAPVRLGIIGLGRWAKVLTRAAQKSDKLKIAAAFSRSAETRNAFTQEFGVPTVTDLSTMLSDPTIKGVILTVPNEQHLPIAEQAAKAGKHVYTEKPIADTLVNGIKLAALEKRHGIRIVVGHSARLLAGTRLMKRAIDAGELGRIVFMEGNFSNERALELTPQTWRWYKAKAPGGPLSQLAVHIFDSLHCLGGSIEAVSSHASKLSPVGAEVDDQSMTVLKFTDGKLGYVGASWTSPGVYAIRVFGQKGLMHYEVDFSTWDTPHRLHESSTLYIQRGKDGYGRREVLELPASDMFVDELEMFAESIASGRSPELSAYNGVVAVAVVNAALRSVDANGCLVKLAEVIGEAEAQAGAKAV